MNTFLGSSQPGVAIKLRIKALIPLFVPVLNNLLEGVGVNLVPEYLDQLVDAAFLLVGAVMEIWGWIRAYRNK